MSVKYTVGNSGAKSPSQCGFAIESSADSGQT